MRILPTRHDLVLKVRLINVVEEDTIKRPHKFYSKPWCLSSSIREIPSFEQEYFQRGVYEELSEHLVSSRFVYEAAIDLKVKPFVLNRS